MEPNEILKKLREEKQLTMTEVSKDINMATSLISDYETGKKAIGMKVALRFADYYHVSLDYLMGRTTIKQIATIEPEFMSEVEISEMEKRIIERYTQFDEKMRKTCIDIFIQLSETLNDVPEAFKHRQRHVELLGDIEERQKEEVSEENAKRKDAI